MWSKNHLIKLVGDGQIQILTRGKGYYGRQIGEIFVKDSKTSLNYQMIEDGFALLYPGTKYSNALQRRRWENAWHWAYSKNLGIWKTLGFYSPKAYRNKKRF